MDDKYLDEKLKGILESPPEYPINESALADMEKKLGLIQAPKKMGSPAFLWWLPLLFLPFLIAGIYFFIKYESLSLQMEMLNATLATVQKDSLQEKHITYHFDTIYTTIYKEILVEKATANTKNDNSSLFNFQRNISTNDLSRFQERGNNLFIPWSLGPTGPVLLNKGPYSSFINNGQGIHLLFIGEDKESAIVSDPDFIPYIDISSLLYHVNTHETLEDKTINVVPSIRKKNVNPINYFIPIGFKGAVRYAPSIYHNALGDNNGNVFGVQGEIQFIKNVSLQIGLERLSLGIDLKDDPAAFASYPIAMPDDPSDVLHELKGNLNYLQIPVILKKSFFNKNKINPYLNMGFVARRPYSQKFTYEYINATGEYKAKNNFKEGEYKINSWRLGIGADREIIKDISANVELNYQYAMDRGVGEYFQLKYVGLNLGIQYGF